MTYYVPGAEEKDLSKVIKSLQQAAGSAAAATTNVATNTANIATNTANIATNTSDIATISAAKVTGPASATDNALVRFDNTTGKLVQNSEITLGDSDGKLARSAGISVAGTNTNDNAASGYIGEIIEYSQTSTGLTSAAGAVNLANGAFSAGDWEIWGYIAITSSGATSLTNYTFSVSSTSATHDNSAPDRYDTLRFGAGWSDPIINKTIGPHRRSLSGSTTLYLTATATFTSVLNVTSKIRGRRVR